MERKKKLTFLVDGLICNKANITGSQTIYKTI